MNNKPMEFHTASRRFVIDSVADYVYEGGFAWVYAKEEIAFKLFKDKNYLLPEKKFSFLSKFDEKHIVKPLEYFYSSHGLVNPVGFTMKYLQKQKYFTLLKVMSNTFWKKHGMNAEKATKLFMSIIETASHVLANKCYIPDPNPGNCLVDNALWHFLIDVDSWGTPEHPSSMVAPGVMDFNEKHPNERSMWYGLAVIGFQLFTGAHPFLDGDDAKHGNDLEVRFRSKRSVFVPEIKSTLVNVRDFGMIPSNLMQWFTQTFHEEKRQAPSASIQPPATVQKKKPGPSYQRVQAEGLVIKRIFEFGKHDVGNFYQVGGLLVALANDKLHVLQDHGNDSEFKIESVHDGFCAMFVIEGERIYVAKIRDDLFLSEHVPSGIYDLKMVAANSDVFHENGIIFGDGKFHAIEAVRFGKMAVSMRQVGRYLDKSTEVFPFEGIAVQRLFDANIVHQIDGNSIVSGNVKIPKSETITNAVASGRVSMIETFDRNGRRKVRLVSGESEQVSDKAELTMAVVGKRIFFIEDGNLVLVNGDFSSRVDFKSDFFDSGVTLRGGKFLCAAKGNSIYRVGSNK